MLIIVDLVGMFYFCLEFAVGYVGMDAYVIWVYFFDFDIFW